MTQWLRFLRWPNLVIIVLTMWLVRYVVIAPELAGAGRGVWEFWGMTLSVVLIAAAGYVANDIRDRKIDAVNKPNRVFVGRELSVAMAQRMCLALLLGALVSLVPLAGAGLEPWMLVFPLAALALLSYAAVLKCTPVVGNVVVAALSALVPWVVLMSERGSLAAAGRAGDLVAAYALFAFTASLFREVVKDLEDAGGDGAQGCRTLAVRAPDAARVTAFLSAGALGFGVVLFLAGWGEGFAPWVAGWTLVLLPLGASVMVMVRSNDRAGYARASVMAKLTMLGGLALLPLLAR